MGALHEGHLALIRRAKKLVSKKGTVAVSIFVNPTQFAPNEDLVRYPRPLKNDLRLCREAGVDLLFHPAPAQMYAADSSTFVQETELETVLCGRSRPGHFRGVCTVVAKLFNILAPDIAVFGEKDFQQLAVIRRMTRDLNFPIQIVGVETVREPDGLALSSRNRYLSADQRAQAAVIRRSLLAGAEKLKTIKKITVSERKKSVSLVKSTQQMIAKMIATSPLAKIDYIEILDADSLTTIAPETNSIVIAAAVFFGKTRLIDNIVIKAK